MNQKIARFLADRAPETPCLVVDLDAIAEAYELLCRYLSCAKVYYAVKANPAAEIIAMLAAKEANFDVASPAEIALCLGHGATPQRLSFGNTIKKEKDIAFAYAAGVRLYAFDSAAELEKLARGAPGARVFCRILVSCEGADWPLSRKFGCAPDMAVGLLQRARELGLDPYGVSFHVGSQQTDLGQWDKAVGAVARMFTLLAEGDISLKMVNIGGGFPAQYRGTIASLPQYAQAVTDALTRHFGNRLPEIIVEPGRSLVGDAGVIQSEVVLIADKGDGGGRRWVYLDVGKFNGLAETMAESIKYRIEPPACRCGAPAPVVLAGPTCDSADILYERTEYRLPEDLAVGDRIAILSAGAYTASYASVGFNGFPPLRTYCI
ncbi:MAG TPA: type III PLP-dependent enzyme [Stellaceae bacterium]|nr:type III PLP-dependent enzyme [Stellaceae bacterium]